MASAGQPLLLDSSYSDHGDGVSPCLDLDKQELPTSEEDLLPTPPHLRSFTGLDMAALWWGFMTSISTFYVAGSLVEQGMSWWQGLLAIVAANVVQAALAISVGHAGAKYGIAFPVQCRASMGVRGAHFATLVRGIVACGWFGIDAWIGGQALFAFIDSLCSDALQSYSDVPWLDCTVPELVCFFLFWLLQVGSFWNGVHGIRSLEKYASPVLLLLCAVLLIWASVKAGGFGEIFSQTSQFGKDGANGGFWIVWLAGVTANVGSYAPLSLNNSDFTRYARSQADQIWGQLWLPLFSGAFAMVGLAVSSATEKIFGYIISNPTDLIGEIGGVFPTLFALFAVTLAILTTSVASIVAPANALINMFPNHFNFRKGALLTAVLSILIQPWRLYQTGDAFLNTWLLGYSFLLGPLAGIILVDYYILRHCILDIPALYGVNEEKAYNYFWGFNLKAFAAFLVGSLPNIPGFLYTVGILKQVPYGWVLLYKVSWFSSFLLSSLFFWLLSLVGKRVQKNHTML